MERSWSDAAQAALDAYPWKTPHEKAKARELAELVSFGDQVEVADLPLSLRQWLRRQTPAPEPPAPWTWKGERWDDLVAAFERTVLEQALAAHGGFAAKAARALGTTARVVSYKARKYGLNIRTRQQEEKD